MSLTISVEPNSSTAVYNPIVFEFDSDVASDFTIGGEIESETTTNNNGYVQIFNSSAGHGLLQGDFIKISQNGGISSLSGIWIVTKIIDTETFVINAPYTIAPTSPVWYFKYLKNYNAVIRVFAYNLCDASYKLIAKLTLKPRFVGGFCKFYIDVADILKDFNNECNTADDVISSDLFPLISAPIIQTNNNSFLSFYISYAEGFDNPISGDAEYIETSPSDL
jgi:hypothetical protein